MSLAELILENAISPVAGWSDSQQELADRLAPSIRDLASDADVFVKRALQTLVLHGDCRGLAFMIEPNSSPARPLLCQFLDNEILYAATEQPQPAGRVSVALMAVERLARAFSHLRADETDSEWDFLFSHPRPNQNRLIYYHLSISSAPAFNLLSPVLQIGICSKIKQLLTVATDKFDERLAGFTNPTVRIVNAIPASVLRPSLINYASGELDLIIHDLIRGMKKKISSTHGGDDYRPASLQTLWADWCAARYALSAKRSFQLRSGFSRLQAPSWSSCPEPESVHPSDRSRRQFYKLVFKQEQQEQERLFRKTRRKEFDPNQPRRALMDGGHACLAANPSPGIPGSLPHVVLGLVQNTFEHRISVFREPNTWGEYCFVSLLLHLGRSPEWMLDIHLGDQPRTWSECSQPIYNAASGRIYNIPDLYVGYPALLCPGEKDPISLDAIWLEHNQIYESVDLIHQIILPAELNKILRTYLTVRTNLLEKYPENTASLNCTDNSGLVWLGIEAGQLVRWNRASISNLMKRMTASIREHIPGQPPIHPSHFIKSFQAYYAQELRSEFRYYVSGHASYATEIPLIYSRVHTTSVAQAHAAACSHVYDLIQQEQKYLLGTDTKSIPIHENYTEKNNEPDTSYCGSWRVIRTDIVQQIIHVLADNLIDPMDWDCGLTEQQWHQNALARWSAVVMALLMGLRTFEIPRILVRHLDLPGSWLAISGKARGEDAAYRRIPILSEISPLLSQLSQLAIQRQKAHIFGFYDQTGIWKPATSNALEEILENISHVLRLPYAPAFYGLRHCFRSNMLEQGVPEHLLNYLMGHQSRGVEAFNPYLERSLSDLARVYRMAARKMEQKYAIFAQENQNENF